MQVALLLARLRDHEPALAEMVLASAMRQLRAGAAARARAASARRTDTAHRLALACIGILFVCAPYLCALLCWWVGSRVAPRLRRAPAALRSQWELLAPPGPRRACNGRIFDIV